MESSSLDALRANFNRVCTAELRRTAAKSVIAAVLDEGRLVRLATDAKLTPGETAAQCAASALEVIRSLYGIETWTPETFERVFLGEAIDAWKGGQAVVVDSAGLALISAHCPIRAGAAAHPAACDTCQLFHESAARAAFGRRLRGWSVESLISEGAEACKFTVRVAPSPTP